MLDQMLLEKVLRKALCRGGDYADVFVEWKRPTTLQMEEGRIEKVLTGVEQGAGIRVLFDGKTAFAFSNDLREETLLLAARGLSVAVARGKGAPELSLMTQRPAVDFTFRERPDAVALPRKVSLLREADHAARALGGEKVRQVSLVYRDSVQRVQVATSEGALAEDERIHTISLVNVVAQEKDVVQTGYETMGGLVGFELFAEESFVQAALRAVRRALAMLTARRAPGGRMPVVVSSEAGGTMIHEAIGHGLEADLAGQGLSKFSGLLGRQVASPLVTVIDDATLPGKRGSFRFDDEGTPSARTVLVKDGVLRTYMFDKLSAMREGAQSTGNGRRESYRHRPIPRMTNTFIAPGASEPEDIVRSTARGLLVKRMGGGQVNTVTGEFVFDVQEGYLIENGAQGEAVRGATLTGNGPDVLMNLDMVGSDLGFAIGTCGKDAQGVPVSDAMPTVRIAEMVVGGEV
ncbi:MAG: TldD/PmbA family protein [Nitrospirota bacterium]